MSSEKQQRKGNQGAGMAMRPKQKSGLSRHYGEIGIKAVAAATRKVNSAAPRRDNRKRYNTEGGYNE
jgi:hypothetical protein